jgi:hypothetical protein
MVHRGPAPNSNVTMRPENASNNIDEWQIVENSPRRIGDIVQQENLN